MRDEPSQQRNTPEPAATPDTPAPAPAEHAALRRLPVLPRRTAQRHLEPQLREPRGAGAGTPFAAFEAPTGDESTPPPADPAEEPDTAPGPRTTESRGGTHRAHGG